MNVKNERPEWIFKTTPEKLSGLLLGIDEGKIALPEFQRDWVWEPENIRELLISVSQSFPAGSLLSLRITKKTFQTRYFAETNVPLGREPEQIILDGQQRLTALFQTLQSKKGVKKGEGRFFFYVSLRKLLDGESIEEALFYVDESKKVRDGKEVLFELNTQENEFENKCLPLSCILHDDYRIWRRKFLQYYRKKGMSETEVDELDNKIEMVHKSFIEPIQNYEFPMIELHPETPLKAVCHIFEKVNTTGVTLTVFELLTAILWPQDIDLRKKWKSTKEELNKLPNMEGIDIDNVTFIQTLSLLSTYAKKMSNPDKKIAVSCKRDDLLEITAKDIENYWDKTLAGYKEAARILFENGVYSDNILPYKTMLAPLAAICAQLIVDKGGIKSDVIYTKIKQWYWRSVFTWRYSSGAESKSAQDFLQVMNWINEGDIPDSVRHYEFNKEMLYEITTVRNAAYRGILCLLLKNRPLDFKSGFEITTQLYHDHGIDHHHIFPSKYLEKGIPDLEQRKVNCILNKTLIDAST
ncbi:MAG: GmrSD restriction endonuclease domain-containing protein, partial [Fervidobacterium sp.]